MSELTHDDVREILDLIDRSQSDYFQLQMGDLKLLVSKSAPLGAAPAVPSPATAPLANWTPTTEESPRAAGGPAAASAKAEPNRTGLAEVRAPMVGTFYAQSEPGAPPFVQAGSAVDQDATMGLIEVMKVYTAILAGTTGTVAEVLVDNAQFVEYGEVLFYIQPTRIA